MTYHCRPGLDLSAKMLPMPLDKVQIRENGLLKPLSQFNLWTLGTGLGSVWGLQLQIWILQYDYRMLMTTETKLTKVLHGQSIPFSLGCILGCTNSSYSVPMVMVALIRIRDHWVSCSQSKHTRIWTWIQVQKPQDHDLELEFM